MKVVVFIKKIRSQSHYTTNRPDFYSQFDAIKVGYLIFPTQKRTHFGLHSLVVTFLPKLVNYIQ